MSVLLTVAAGQAQSQTPAQIAAIPPPGIAAKTSIQATPNRRTFTKPEEAVHALITAVAAPTLEPLIEILGRGTLESVPPEERQSAEVRRATGRRLAGQRFEIEYTDAERTRAVALFGDSRVSLPALLEKTRRGWMFDPEATTAAIRERRIGANEANAIRALRAFAQAQDTFRLRDMAGDGVLQYARRIRSTPGENDGLVASEGVPGPVTSLLNEAFARAEGEPGEPALRPIGGYAYKMLQAQGAGADGGAKSYSINGRLSEGYAVIAWPTRPGENGLSTFIMNHHGTIFEREFGDQTAAAVRPISAFDPGPGWTRVDAAKE
jgi:hypothetical protein